MYYDKKYRQKRVYHNLDKKVVEPTIKLLNNLAGSGLKERPGQEMMASDIAEAIRDSEDLIIEAGVGIGKSYGYLIPAIFARNATKRPVLIATSSIQLSEQLIDDAEYIKKLTGNQSLKVVLGKGMTNYLCRKRYDEIYLQLPKIHEKQKNGEVLSLSEQNSLEVYNGLEMSDLITQRNEINISEKNWSLVSVSDCKHDKCSFCNECDYYKMRQSISPIGDADIIIVNQDLYISHLLKKERSGRSILKDNPIVTIIDEAHNLEEKTRSRLTEKWSMREINKLFSKISSSMKKAENSEYMEIAEDSKRSLKLIFDEIWDQVQQKNAEGDRIRDSGRYPVCTPSALKYLMLKKDLSTLAVAATTTIRGVSEDDQEFIAEQVAQLTSLLSTVANPKQSVDLLWAEVINSRNGGIALCCAPKDIAGSLNDLMFSRNTSSVILTSATLCQPGKTDEEKYSYQKAAIGFEGECSPPQESPFPYDENSRLYISEDIEPPNGNREKYIRQIIERIIELVTITKGRTMILFTAKNDMQEVHRKLYGKVPWQVICQQDGSSQTTVIDEFKRTGGILLGCGIFWEGINIPGLALSSVIITRLPFPVPDAIIEFKCQNATDKLTDVLIPEMITKLRQGAGRLIRDETDTGILSILDSRLSEKANKTYRNITLNSLPIKTYVTSLDEVPAFSSKNLSPKILTKGA